MVMSMCHEWGDMYLFSVATAVHGFFIYKGVWESAIGKSLPCG